MVGMPTRHQLVRTNSDSLAKSQTTQHPVQSSHFAIKQSIIPWTSSILFWMEKLIKLVSTRTRYGGPRSVLCERKRLMA